MPYPPNHRPETRARIILSARKLFNRFGFDGVSVQQIMADAGLTHGGFYRYFASKSDLYAEVLECFFTDPEWNNNWEGVHVDVNASDAGAQIVRAYLSRAFQTVFEAMVDLLQRSTGRNGRSSRTSALAIAALCVGGMVVARASEGGTLANELRHAAMEVAIELGGWNKIKNSKRIPSGRRRAKKSERLTA